MHRRKPRLRASLTTVLIGAVVGVAGIAGAAPAQAAQSSADALCNKANPAQFSKTYNIRFGKKTVYNRDLSRSLVCSGAFGAPDNFRATFASACDLAMAAYNVVNPAESVFKTWGCAAPAIRETGWVRGSLGSAAGVACGYLADVLGVGSGLLAAGVTLDPAAGVATWKGVTFVGDTVVCIGVSNVLKDARSWGIKLESRHETAVARDIEVHGKCLQMTNRKVVGIQFSAISCPPGFGGSRLPTPPQDDAAGSPAQGPDTSTPAVTSGPAVLEPQAAGPTPVPETTGGVTNTWSNFTNAGGTHGPSIAAGQTVAVACKIQGFRVADGNTWWYRVASAPWSNNYYASADAFYNNGQASGSLHGTPFVDPAVPGC